MPRIINTLADFRGCSETCKNYKQRTRNESSCNVWSYCTFFQLPREATFLPFQSKHSMVPTLLSKLKIFGIRPCFHFIPQFPKEVLERSSSATDRLIRLLTITLDSSHPSPTRFSIVFHTRRGYGLACLVPVWTCLIIGSFSGWGNNEGEGRFGEIKVKAFTLAFRTSGYPIEAPPSPITRCHVLTVSSHRALIPVPPRTETEVSNGKEYSQPTLRTWVLGIIKLSTITWPKQISKL